MHSHAQTYPVNDIQVTDLSPARRWPRPNPAATASTRKNQVRVDHSSNTGDIDDGDDVLDRALRAHTNTAAQTPPGHTHRARRKCGEVRQSQNSPRAPRTRGRRHAATRDGLFRLARPRPSAPAPPGGGVPSGPGRRGQVGTNRRARGGSAPPRRHAAATDPPRPGPPVCAPMCTPLHLGPRY